MAVAIKMQAHVAELCAFFHLVDRHMMGLQDLSVAVRTGPDSASAMTQNEGIVHIHRRTRIAAIEGPRSHAVHHSLGRREPRTDAQRVMGTLG